MDDGENNDYFHLISVVNKVHLYFMSVILSCHKLRDYHISSIIECLLIYAFPGDERREKSKKVLVSSAAHCIKF